MKTFLASFLFLAFALSASAQNTLAGNLTVQKTVTFSGAITPPALTANANDYAPANFSTATVLRVSSDAARTITGLAGGAGGRLVSLINIGSQTITLASESSLSTAANRFAFGVLPFDIAPGGSLSIWYDATSARWRSTTNLTTTSGSAIDQTARDAASAAQATADSKQAALSNAATLAKVTESAGLPLWDGAAWPGGGSGGTGTVTSVSVVNANGVSGTVSNASTTPAVTLSLGAVTPTSVAASGAMTGSNLSGTNTGDETASTIKTKLGITTLSGSNTGDQTDVTGNAGTATKLATARQINGVNFDGTANITAPAAAGTLTGTALASNVVSSSLTSAAGGSFGTAAFTASTAYDSAGAAAAITLSGLGGVPTTRTVNGHALSANVTVTAADLSLATVATSGSYTDLTSKPTIPAAQVNSDWNAVSGLAQILNKPTLFNGTWSSLSGKPANVVLLGSLVNGAGWLYNDGAGVLSYSSPTKTTVGLGNVENTALSTWTGSANLATVGTIATGTWHGTAIADTYIASAATWNGKQAAYTNLTSFGSLANASGWLKNNGTGTLSYSTPTKSDVGLGNVENTALSTWAGSTNVTTLGTVGTGTWNATAIADGKIASVLTGKTYNGLTPTAASTGFTIAGGTTSKTLTVIGDATVDNWFDQSLKTTSAPTFAGLASGTAWINNQINGGTSAAPGDLYINYGSQGFDTFIQGTKFVVKSSGAVGIGTTSPSYKLDIQGGSLGVKQGNNYTKYGSFSGGVWQVVDTLTFGTYSGMTSSRANGTPGSESAVSSGDTISEYAFYGYDGSAYAGGAGIRIIANQNYSTSAHGSKMEFYTTPDDNAGNWWSQTPRLVIGNTGDIRISGYGAGTLVTDSSGNITASSDARLKNVTGSFTRGLDSILQLSPKVYTWKPESGMNPNDVNVGFIAQEVKPAIPEAVGSVKTRDVEQIDSKTGKKSKTTKREASEFLSLSDRPIIAALVNAVKELKAENDDLKARLEKLESKK